jgi:hypothetical protein
MIISKKPSTLSKASLAGVRDYMIGVSVAPERASLESVDEKTKVYKVTGLHSPSY